MRRLITLSIVSLLSYSNIVVAQDDLATRLTATDYRLTYDQTRTLGVDVHALAFFKNNEFGGPQATGYTLPGFWIQPRLAWQPLDAIRLEAGFHAMVFHGAGKYPCFAYHDIARWKGDHYQRGAHVLPFLRAQAQLRDVTFVLGNIYGGANHRLVEPLMNAEVNLSQDPEMGFQLLVDRPRYHLDAWINWQSFIFREETHQEAFTVGLSQRITLTPQRSTLNAQRSTLTLYIPIDILIQHRGGEIDVSGMGVQTIDNAALGLGLRWNANRKVLNGLTAEAMALGCWQQTGELWPFDSGLGAAATLSADLLAYSPRKGLTGRVSHRASAGSAAYNRRGELSNIGQLRFFATVVYAKDFVPIYGAPFFSTVSQKTGNRFSHILTPHIGLEWSHTFASDYVLGAKVDTYLARTGTATEEVPAASATGTPTTLPSAFNNNFSFGVFLRCSPHFLVKRFKQ